MIKNLFSALNIKFKKNKKKLFKTLIFSEQHDLAQNVLGEG